MRKSFEKIIALLLIIGLNWFGLSAVGETVAYFYDAETSSGNIYSAGSLDFALSSYEYESSIGLDETVSKSSVLVNSGGMDFQYILETEEISDDDGFCGALNLQAKLNGVEKYNGVLMSLNTSALTALGTWKFNIELPVDEDSFTNEEECRFDIVFKGWQTNIVSYGDGGFTDEERMSFILTAGKMVVLNEFLPRPDGIAYGFYFGNDSSDMPQGEWIELYNNSTEPVNVAGWYTRDATDGSGNKVVITALNTSPATTIIGGKSWLVVYMNKPILNNTGDTVRLFNSDDVLIDSHAYAGNDFCEIEPTPGDENSTDALGECAGVPPNKSYARIPDGIGAWVDPIPTPGRTNQIDDSLVIISEEAAEAGAPLSDSTINLDEDLTEIPSVFEEEIIITPEETIVVMEEPAEETITEPEPVAEEEILPTEEQVAELSVEPQESVAGETSETAPQSEPVEIIVEIVDEEVILPEENLPQEETPPAEEPNI